MIFSRTRQLSLLLLAAILAGCHAGSNFSPPLPAWQRPEFLYLRATPYDRLYVEIDTVEGARLDPRFLPAMKEFLQAHCDKSDGIEFVHDDAIPLKNARGMDPCLIALANMAGPPLKSSEKQAAYLYVLIYDSDQLGLREADNPHVALDYPCAIFVDLAWERPLHKRMAVRIAQHEAGHILGLCRNPSHANGLHCENPDCLMGAIGISIWGVIFGGPPLKQVLCDDCLADLAAYKHQPLERYNMSFNGPALVRQENGYLVASLPFHIQVPFKPPGAFDGREMLANARRLFNEARAEAQRTRTKKVIPLVHCLDEFTGAAETRAAYGMLSGDPNRQVSAWARQQLKALEENAPSSAPANEPTTSPAAK